MTKEEFNTIIKPLSLLDAKPRVFMQNAILKNFENWKKEAINFTDSCEKLKEKINENIEALQDDLKRLKTIGELNTQGFAKLNEFEEIKKQLNLNGVSITLPKNTDLLLWTLDKVTDKRIELGDKLTEEMLKEITQAYIDCYKWIEANGN